MRAILPALRRSAICCVLLVLITACGASIDLLTDSLPALPVTPANASAWQSVTAGLEWRAIVPNDDELAQLKVLRIEPKRFRFRALYSPGNPLNLPEWRALEPEAVIIVNANFYDPHFQALGLVISDGKAFGLPYRDRGGTLVVKENSVSIRSFRSGSLRLEQTIDQAVQGFPMLVENGEQAYFNQSSTRRARRTIVATDKAGRILIMVTPFLGQSLAELSAFLPTTDLDIVTAMNLDGGGSTMMAFEDIEYLLPAFDAVPTVLAIYRR